MDAVGHELLDSDKGGAESIADGLDRFALLEHFSASLKKVSMCSLL